MPNGMDGWISHKQNEAENELSDANRKKDSQDKSNDNDAKDSLKGADYPSNLFIGGSMADALAESVGGDELLLGYLAEMGGNSRNSIKSAEDLQMEAFLERQRSGNSLYKEADFDLKGWLDDLFGGLDDTLEGIDIVMPSIDLQGFAALAMLPKILLGFKADLSNWLKFDIKEYQDTLTAMEAATKRPEME